MSLTKSNLLCRNNCGFYGNPAWNNYCSKCYHIIMSQPVGSDETRSPQLTQSASSNSFAKFEEKRKQFADKSQKTVKNLFKITQNIFEGDNKRKVSTTIPEAQQLAKDNFIGYLRNFKSKQSDEIVRLVSEIVDINRTFPSIDHYSEALQTFYTNMAKKFNTSPLFADILPKERERLMSSIEIFVTSWIHVWAFASRATDDELEDMKFSDKARSLDWVTPAMLGAVLDPSNPNEKALIEEAHLSLIKMDSVLSTLEKLTCIVEACHKVNRALEAHMQNDGTKTESTNADLLLPALIYVLLIANPPQFYCHIQFITRFANQTRLSSGEHGFCFTNLCCAMSFIQKINHESFQMNEQEYDSRLKGIHSHTMNGCSRAGQRSSISEHDIALLDIDEKLEATNKILEDLHKDMISFDEEVTTRVSRLLKDKGKEPIEPRHLTNPKTLLDEKEDKLLDDDDPPSYSSRSEPFPQASTSGASISAERTNETQYEKDLIDFFEN